MSGLDLHELALRLRAIETLRRYTERRKLAEAQAWWQRLVQPN